MLDEAIRAAQRPETPALRAATITGPPDAQGRVEVTVRSSTGGRLRHSRCPIPQRVRVGAGGALELVQPARGDVAWVAFDEARRAVVVCWEPRTSA